MIATLAPPLEAMWRGLTWRRLALVAGVSFVFATQIFFQDHILEFEIEDTLQAFVEYYGEIALVGFLVLLAVTAVDHRFPEQGSKRSAALVMAVVLPAAMGVAIGLVARYRTGYYPPMLYALGEVMRWATVTGILALVYELQRRDRAATKALRLIEMNRIVLERRRMEARLKMLQAQIEPHFLFNTLATVKRLFHTEPQSGAAMLGSLTLYLKGALPRLRDDESSLGDEMELVRAYLEILQVRMGERLRFSTELPGGLERLAFPSMMLITLVENAVKHGIDKKPEGGKIEVRARVNGSRIRIEVSDSGVGLQASSGTGVGLSSVRARLQALYGDLASLGLEPNDPMGVVASLDLPLAQAVA